MGRAERRPRVMVLGLRGIPDVQGGVERHVEELAPLLAARGWDVEVVGRRRYLGHRLPRRWRGVTIAPLWAPRANGVESLVHTLFGVAIAALRRPDIVHIHAIGPALLTPLARLLGLRVVVTHHGTDYERAKFSPIARWVLRFGERAGMRFANQRIAVSKGIAATMRERYGVPVNFVPNGVTIRPVPEDRSVLERFGLLPGRYVVLVARNDPVKRHADLIAAFDGLDALGWKLALVGGSEYPTAYDREIATAAAAVPGVVLTGQQSGKDLAALFGHAGLFVLPSSQEGMPISLLEALGYGLPVLASDIEANLALGLPADCYFPVGNVPALAAAMRRRIAALPGQAEREAQIARVAVEFAWEGVAGATDSIYRQELRGRRLQTVSAS